MTDDLSPVADRRRLLARAERLLDRWLTLFEAALDDATPDPSKTAELANVFTICRRVLEIDRLLIQIEEKDRADAAAGHAMDPELLIRQLREPDSDDD